MIKPKVASRLKGLCVSCPSRAGGICCGLTAEELGALSGTMRHCYFSAGEQVIHRDDVSELFAVIVSGAIKLTRNLPDGREQIVALLTEADCLGDLFAQESHDTATCVTDVELCCFARSKIKSLLKEHPDLERRFLVLAMNDLEDARAWLLTIGRKNAIEKVATFLLWLLKKQHRLPHKTLESCSDLAVDLTLNRSEIGDFLGLTLETVSRQMSRLRQAGAIRVDESHRVIIEKRDLLEQLAHTEA